MSEAKDVPYKVLVDDNFHYMDASERYELGQFDTLEAAVQASQCVVDEFLASHHRLDMSAHELYQNYVSFGEDPFIIAVPPAEDEKPDFSAWSYAKARCSQLCPSTRP